MEEKILKMKGLTTVSSSELLSVKGGTCASIGTLLKKLADLIKKIKDYIPDFVEGLTDGLNS